MNIVVFADMHGRIFLAWKLVERLQRERGITIDLVLQCGDMGAYPFREKMDKATLRHAQRDETELGFSRYFYTKNKEVEALLGKLGCEMWAVRGNHEDHNFLDSLEEETQASRYAIDAYNRILMLKTGKEQAFQAGKETISIVGINRIGHRGNKFPNGQPRYIQSYEVDNLAKLRRTVSHFDILISHDCDLHFFDKDFGMEEIGTCLQHHKPFYQFFGHTGHPYQTQMHDNNFTQCVKVAELTWEKHFLPVGSMLLLQWQNQFEHNLEPIADAWLNEYTEANWLYVP